MDREATRKALATASDEALADYRRFSENRLERLVFLRKRALERGVAKHYIDGYNREVDERIAHLDIVDDEERYRRCKRCPQRALADPGCVYCVDYR